jgi:hypothetical protein
MVSEEKLTRALTKWFVALDAVQKRQRAPQSLILQKLQQGSLADLNDSSLSLEDTPRRLAQLSPTFARLASEDPSGVRMIDNSSVLDAKLKSLDGRRAIGLG